MKELNKEKKKKTNEKQYEREERQRNTKKITTELKLTYANTSFKYY